MGSDENNLGNALRSLGKRATDTEQLEQAEAAYRGALLERTRERVPLQWARTQNNLGLALAILGERRQSVDLYQDAKQAVENAYDAYVVDAGYTQYEDYFERRLRELDETIKAAQQ